MLPFLETWLFAITALVRIHDVYRAAANTVVMINFIVCFSFTSQELVHYLWEECSHCPLHFAGVSHQNVLRTFPLMSFSNWWTRMNRVGRWLLLHTFAPKCHKDGLQSVLVAIHLDLDNSATWKQRSSVRSPLPWDSTTFTSDSCRLFEWKMPTSGEELTYGPIIAMECWFTGQVINDDANSMHRFVLCFWLMCNDSLLSWDDSA